MAGHGEVEAYRILLLIVSHLVDDPDTVEIEIILGEHGTMFHVRADQRNTAFLLGKQGRTARSIRTIMGAIGRKACWNYYIEFEGNTTDTDGPVE
jgi:predicted RNA-binding protein YlqC (UPF0109 family)